MCRLLGVIANKPVDLEFSLERFKKFSSHNPDGWGIGWYEKNAACLFKQGISAEDQQSELPNLSKEVRSNIIITHVRKGTVGKPSEENSHPFKYKNWLFAHNGWLDGEYLLSLLASDYKNEIEGETDSEVYFYWILQNIEDYGDVEGIKKAISSVIQKGHSGLNFLLSNGENLYAFRYSSGSHDYYSLYTLKRNPSERTLQQFVSEETKALIRSKSLKGEKAVLVCSEELTKGDEEWKAVENGKMLIIKPDLEIECVPILK